MESRTKLLFFIVTSLAAAQAMFKGCYEETVRRRHFSISPGDYNPELMTVLMCMSSCGAFSYEFAAIASGKFCYCANTLPSGKGAVPDTFCNITCFGDPKQTCGGFRHVSVFSAIKKITGLSLTSDAADTIIPVGKPVNFDVSISSGNDVIYKFNYDDGSATTSPNMTSMLTTTYQTPGEYNVRVYANDVNQTFQDQVAATTVRVDAPPGKVEVECEPVFGTFEEGICTCVVWSGSSLSITVTVSSQSLTFFIEDPPLSLAGPPINDKTILPGDGAQFVYLLHASEFSVSGKIIGWETVVSSRQSGTSLIVLLLKPTCTSGSYCYSSNSCSGSCASSSSRATSCPAAEQFCVQAARCQPACASAPSRYTSSASQYQVVQVITLQTTSTGYSNLQEAADILVEPGYMLGIQQDGSQATLNRVGCLPNECDLQLPYKNSAVGTAYTASSAAKMNFRHAIRAIASAGSKVFLPFTFDVAGNFTLTATASSTTLPTSSASSNLTKVVVLEGVNASIVTGPVFGATGDSIMFTVLPHTGNNVFYNWSFSDSTSFLVSREQVKTKVFSVKGVYSINVTTYNAVSQKYNDTEIMIEDRIAGLALKTNPTALWTPTTINLTLTSGSNYICTWDYGDQTATDQTSETEMSTSGISKQHSYTRAGTYNVSVTCANDVSKDTALVTVHVLEIITNLRMVNGGAEKGQDFYLEWQVDTGTEITFAVNFDSKIITAFSSVGTYRWRSGLQPQRPPSSIPLNITASNLLSSDSISLNFQILSVIVAPTLTSNTVNATSHEIVTFTVDMTAGSDVTILIDYGDSVTSSYTQPLGVAWAGPITFDHTYTNGGRFNVKATFTNAAGTYTRSLQVLVLVGVAAIDCDLVDYALYHPPAYVNLTFNASALPTEPTLVLNWGEKQSTDVYPVLQLHTPYPHTFGDTGTFNVTANLTNLLGSKMCHKVITIVEKLSGPSFEQKYLVAAKDLPFNITFCLYRGPSGPRCNLTYDFGDGSPPQVFQRQGAGKDGCDTQAVTYKDKVTKTVVVTATSYLETVSARLTVPIIDGLQDSDVQVITNGDVAFGTDTTFTLKYTGTVIPTDTEVKFDFNDGTTAEAGPFPFGITVPGGTQLFNHRYQKDGLFETRVTIYNAATSVEKIIQVGAYKDFSNLAAELYYMPDIPPNTYTSGLAGDPQLFPANKPIIFRVSDSNNAFATAYNTKIVDSTSGTTVFEGSFSTPVFSVQLNQSTSYTIDISARNPLYNSSIASKTVRIIQLVEGFSLVEATPQVRMNEVKAFNVSFTKMGTDTCVYVNFGDGSQSIFSDVLASCDKSDFTSVKAADKHALATLTRIEHVYMTEGYYTVTAIAENSQSVKSSTVSFSITGLDCSKPAVTIYNGQQYFTQATIYKRSDKISIQGMSSIQCAQSYTNSKSWRIQKMDPSFDTVMSEISLTGLDTSRAELYIPPRFLDLGLYRIYYLMTMMGRYGSNKFESEAHTYIQVKSSDLIGVMMPGGASGIERGTAQILTLDPLALSRDPDVDPKGPQGLTVTNWTCEMLNNTSVGCDLAGFSSSGQKQTLTLSALELQTYRIRAFLQKDTRTASTEIYLTVVNGNPPIVSLEPVPGSVYFQLSRGYKILQTSRFALNCVCTSCTSSSTVSYMWSVYLYDYRWPDSWRLLQPDDLDDRVVGQYEKQMSIQSSLFELFNATRMRVDCLVTENGMSSKVMADLQVNTPPTPGTCTVSPFNTTVTTEKVWTLDVNGWTDDDGIAEYQFFIHTDSNTVDKQITSVQTDQGGHHLQVCLSEGPDYNNYQQQIVVKVRDTLGGSLNWNCGIVVVRQMPIEDIRALTKDIKTNQLHDLERMFAEGDQKTCTEKATNIMSLLNSDTTRGQSKSLLETEYAGYKLANNFVNSMYGQTDEGRPSYRQEDKSIQSDMIEYQMETERNDRAKVRKSMITNMLLFAPKSVVAIQQVCSFFAEATVYGDEIGQDCQEKVMDAMENMTNFLADPDNIDNVPSEDIEIALKNIQAVVGYIMDAAGSNGFQGTLDELDAATQDVQWFDYDTSVDAIGTFDFSSAGSYEEAMKLHTARIHKLRQAKTAAIIREKVIKTLDKQVECFSRYSVPGQVLESKSQKMKQVMQKSDVGNLMGQQLSVPDSEGGVILPNTTFLAGMESSDPIVVSVSQTTNNPLRYSEMAEGISPMSNYVSINFYDINNTKLSVPSLVEPITVCIPRDENTKEPSYLSINPMLPSWSTLMTFVLTINRTQSAIHLDFGNITGRQFLLVAKKGQLANIDKDPANDQCDSVSLMPASMTENLDDPGRYRFFLSNMFTGDFTGMVSIGVRELNSSQFDMDVSAGCASLPRYANGSDYFRGTFTLRQYVTQCLAISDWQTDWVTGGCVVNKATDVSKTVCDCNHLTTFAGGWVVVPNTINWSYVFANADFLKNPTIYITVIVTAVLYIIFALMAHYKDKKLAEQLGIAPLADNDPKDKYFYEVIVSTGMRRNAGTDSHVYFVLSGEDDETDVRALSDSKRKIFRRGQVDGFLMAVPRPLGYLNFMRVWHDNSGSGKFGSWYLNYIIIRDVQTDVKQLFIANRWFAVEEDDGQVDRVIPVANHEQTADFSYQFGERTRKDFADGHLWYSVVARPPQSRFTCLQRVSCCLCLLYVTMLTNAMFYNTTSSTEKATNSFSFGPFSIAPEQIFIGVISNLIVFPVNFLLVVLFKKSRPHHKRPSRIDLAIKEVQDQSKQTNINDIKPEVSSIFSVSRTPYLPKDPHRPESSTSRPETAMSNSSTEELTTSKKKKKFELPWYFTIIAWLLLWVVTLGSVAMVIFYGISFQDETCRKWITSMLVSFFMSIFITQPVKVVLFAIILSLIIKNPGEEKGDEEEDEELPCLDQDSELLHGDMSAMNLIRPQKVGYKPPDPQVLEKLREKRLKEIKMWAIIREVILYAFFLWILLVISYRQMGDSNFLYKDTLYNVFIDNKQTDIDFSALRNSEEFWTWATSGLVNGLRAGAYYNDYPPLKLRAYINDKVSRILGYATLRQLRVKPGQCHVPDPVEGLIPECNVAYNMFDQEEGTFRVGWQPLRDDDTLNTTRREYTYTSAKELNGYPYWGLLSWYSGGGYVVPLVGSKDELIQQMQQLQQENWIDRYTRAVFVEFTVYNPQVNLFAIGTILAEFHPSGGMVASVRFEPAMLLPYMTSAMLFQIVCEVVYILFVLFFIIRELKELFKTRLSYFSHFWNLVEVGIIAMSISAIVIFFYRLIVTNELTKAFKETDGNGYVKFQYVAYWNEMFSYMIGFLCFLATLKFLKLLRFNRKMSMLSATLKFSAWSLINFGIIFLIVFLAFSQLFYLTFMHIDIDYSTFVSSMVAGILMMMGKYDIYSMIMAEPVLTQIFVLLFVITVTFIMVNMFVTILNETFSAVREDINKQGNDYEIVNFMLQRFKQWTGLGDSEETPTPPDDPNDLNNHHGSHAGHKMADHVQDFPDRIERLLQTISSVYMDSDNLTMLYQKKPYESQTGNKNLLRTGLSPSPAPDRYQKRKGSSDIIARVHTH